MGKAPKKGARTGNSTTEQKTANGKKVKKVVATNRTLDGEIRKEVVRGKRIRTVKFPGGENRERTEPEEILAHNIKAFRDHIGLTQERLAELFKVKQSAISSIEHGRRSPKLNTIYDLSVKTGIPIEILIGKRIDSIYLEVIRARREK